MSHCVKNSVFAKFWGCQKKVFEKKIAFLIFYVGEIEAENAKKMEKAKKPYEIVFFKVVIQKCGKSKKKWILSNNCLTLFVVRKGEKTHFRADYLFWPKFFGPKQCKARNTIKNRGFSGNCKKDKNDTFFWSKVFFDMVEKVGFTNSVFEKLCLPENTIFIVFFCMLKKTENL